MKALAWLAIAGVTAGLAAVPGSAQSGGTAVIYSSSNYKGQSMTLTGALQGLEKAFIAKSIQVPEGQSWEFCTGRTFSGCKRLDKSVKSGVFNIRSARPVAPVVRANVAAPNQSVRGVASEFFVSPRDAGGRVSIPSNNPEQMREKANAFCRAAGWRQAVHVQLQEGSGAYHLIDVLCANEAN